MDKNRSLDARAAWGRVEAALAKAMPGGNPLDDPACTSEKAMFYQFQMEFEIGKAVGQSPELKSLLSSGDAERFASLGLSTDPRKMEWLGSMAQQGAISETQSYVEWLVAKTEAFRREMEAAKAKTAEPQTPAPQPEGEPRLGTWRSGRGAATPSHGSETSKAPKA